MCYIKNALVISHRYVNDIVKPGDTVIDATAGNGNDTAFLAELVGNDGHVYAFDVQQQALSNTRLRLENAGLSGRVTLIHDGHQNMDKYVKAPVSAVMFNFGYLPGGDKSIGTKGDTSIEAIQKALTLLKPGGMCMAVLYYGGCSGFDEKNAIMDFIKTLDFKQYSVIVHDFCNRPNCPPIAVSIEKV